MPEWFRQSEEGREITHQYEYFLAECSRLLQLGITGFFNGELERCFWGALEPNSFLRPHGVKIESNPSFRSKRGDDDFGVEDETCGSANGTGCYYKTLSPDGKRIATWKVVRDPSK
jgi:hypothetical protein